MQARVQPSSHGELIEYLLSTEQPEMEFETARCRPLITQDFLAFLQEEIGGCFAQLDTADAPSLAASASKLSISTASQVQCKVISIASFQNTPLKASCLSLTTLADFCQIWSRVRLTALVFVQRRPL